ncbi:MAG: hypothetical protein ACJAVC_001936 [Brevundimonas sp.]|jgi:hypothetical protein
MGILRRSLENRDAVACLGDGDYMSMFDGVG